jgi:hypothetical protein
MELNIMGKISKGTKCNIDGCDKLAVRSLSTERVIKAGFQVGETRRTYLCKDHYREFKRKAIVKNQKRMDKWRHIRTTPQKHQRYEKL